MGETKYDWTDKTKTGLSKEEYDALWAQNNINESDISDLGDDIAAHDHDSDYLKLTGGVITGTVTMTVDATPTLVLTAATTPDLWFVDTDDAAHKTILRQQGANFDFYSGGVKRWRYQQASNTIELPAPNFQPSGLENARVALFQDEVDESLWAFWKESGGGNHHAPIARAKRTLVSLSPGMCTSTGGVSQVVIGANTDVPALRFPNSSTTTSAWSFTRPYDWDYGKIRVTVYWTNYDNNVSGNHYWPQRLIGCQASEHLAATQTCNTLIAGAQTTAGLNNSSKIGVTEIDMGSAQDLSNEAVMFYRIQRQGGHGSDTSGQPWEVIHITIKLITT